MEKSRYVKVIEDEEVRGDDPIEYFLPAWVGSTFRAPEGIMTIEVLQNKEISRGGKNGGRKEIGSAICRSRSNRESIMI